MPIRFAKLFEIRTLHRYYTGLQSSDFRLVPTAETERTLARHRLLSRPSENGMLVLAPVEGNPAKLQVPIGEGFRLVFRLELKNPYFLNFTELPFSTPSINYLSPLKTGYYFSNHSKNTLTLTDPDISLNLLSKKAASPVSEDDRVPYWSSALRIALESPAMKLEYKIKTGATEVFSENIDKTAENEPLSEFAPEKPPRLEPGLYSLEKDGGAAQPVYIDDEIYHSRPFGLVEIFHGTNVAADYRFVSAANEPVFRNYHLFFEARNTVWRYRFPSGVEGITVANLGAVNFAKNEGQKMFESSAAIKLTESYQEVKMTKGAVTTNIPNPGITAVKPDLAAGKTYSDIYL